MRDRLRQGPCYALSCELYSSIRLLLSYTFHLRTIKVSYRIVCQITLMTPHQLSPWLAEVREILVV